MKPSPPANAQRQQEAMKRFRLSAKFLRKGILERTGIRDLRIHDLRRTLGSWQAAAGTSLPIIGKSLGHKSLAATQVYARLNLDPVRASVNRATDDLLLAAKAPAKLLGGGNGR